MDNQIPDDPRYTKKNWAGKCMLACNFPDCQYDTFYLMQFDAHYYQRHELPMQPVRRPMRAVLYDSSGSLVTDVEDKGEK